MPKPRSPDRDKAFEIYSAVGGDIPLADIAAQLSVPEGTVRGWKNKDGWDAKLNGTFRKNTERSKRDKKVARQLVASLEANDELNDRQRDFCLYYVQIFNQTQAAIRAGYSPATAYSIGYNLMQNPKIREEIQRLKAIKAAALLAGPEDIVDRMMRIAFASMTDFAEFGRTEVPVMTAFGPLTAPDPDNPEKKKVVTREVNDVRLRESWMVDGAVISKVKVGKDGASIELKDSQKALEWLARYFEMNPSDQHRRDYDAKRLELMERQVKVQEEKDKPRQPDEVVKIIDDI